MCVTSGRFDILCKSSARQDVKNDDLRVNFQKIIIIWLSPIFTSILY